MFMEALNSMGKLTDPYFGNIAPDETVNIYYHMSLNGKEVRGPWNSEPNFKYIPNPLEHRPTEQAGKQVSPSEAHKVRVEKGSTTTSGR
jgi:Mn-containing catalase